MVKILETIHQRKTYFLVFDDTEIIGKFETEQEAQRFVNELNE